MTPEIVQIIVDGVFPLIATIVTVLVLPKLNTLITDSNMQKYVELLVNTAEQLFNNQEIDDRYMYVYNELIKKYNVDEATAKILIEGFVNQLNIQSS